MVTVGAGVFSNLLELRAALLKFGYPAKKETIYHIVSEYDQEYIGELSFADF